MNMPKLALGFGIALIVVGIIGYAFSDSAKAYTALIPSGVGALLAISGGIGLKDSLRMHAMHGAAVIALLSSLAALVGLIMRFSKASTLALFTQGSMLLLSAVFLGLCVKSFIDARKARQAAEAGG